MLKPNVWVGVIQQSIGEWGLLEVSDFHGDKSLNECMDKLRILDYDNSEPLILFTLKIVVKIVFL